jgi:hypothetical protein
MSKYHITWNPSLHPRRPAGTKVGGQFTYSEVRKVKPSTPLVLRINGKEYNPAQPRVPAGDPQGGQWTSTGGGQDRALPENSSVRAAGPGEKLPPESMRPKYQGEALPLVIAPGGTVYIGEGAHTHSMIIHQLGYGSRESDQLIRAVVQQGGRKGFFLKFQTEYLGIGSDMLHSGTYTREEETAIQDKAGKNLGKAARRLLEAGYEPDTPVQWLFWQTGKSTSGDLSHFAGYKMKNGVA